MQLNSKNRLDTLFVPEIQKIPFRISGKNVVVTGLNGVGKTFYLNRLLETLKLDTIKVELIENIFNFDLTKREKEITQALAADIGFSLLSELKINSEVSLKEEVRPTWIAVHHIKRKFKRLQKCLNLEGINVDSIKKELNFLNKVFNLKVNNLSAGQKIIFKLFLMRSYLLS